MQISLTTYDCTFYDPILRSKIQFIFILQFNSYVSLFPFPSVIVNYLGFSPFLLMKLFNLYLNIILVSKINYLLCKTISFFFFNQQGFTILGDQESLVQLHTLVSIIGLNKKCSFY